MDYFYSVLMALFTFVSPCVLPMLPVYVSYFTAGESGKKRTLINALGFTVGLTIVLVAIGAVFSFIGLGIGDKLQYEYRWIVNLISGLIVIILGLNFIGIINIGFLNSSREIKVKTSGMTFLSAIVFGLVYAVSFGPCAIAFQGFTLFNAITTAMRLGNVFKGIMLQLVYALSLGFLFIVCALLIDTLKGVFGFIKRNYKVINLISGCVLIILGILMATGVMEKFSLLMVGA